MGERGPRVDVLADEDAVAAAAAEVLLAAIASGTPSAPSRIAISGGRTPQRTFRLLASRGGVADWRCARIFWADERCVPPSSPDSNFGVASALWLGPAGAPGSSVVRIRGEDGALRGVAEYDEALRREFGGQPGAEGVRGFDLVLLGLGDDGHTASLFPGDAALAAAGCWATAARAPSPPRDRITLTFEALAASARVVFVVTGAAKAPVVRRALAKDPALPAGRVEAERWILDSAAAMA